MMNIESIDHLNEMNVSLKPIEFQVNFLQEKKHILLHRAC